MQMCYTPNTIADRAMSVRLQRGTGYARVRDTDAEAVVKQQFGDQGQVVSKALFKDKGCLIYRRAQLAGEMYQYHIKITLPHTDDGWRILPNGLYFEYSQKIQDFASRLEQMDGIILANYPTLVQDDVDRRNAALMAQGKAPIAHAGEYPDMAHMRRLLYVRYYFQPISTANDFRYEVTPEDRRRMDDLLHDIEETAKADLYQRMLDPIRAFVTKLSTPIGQEGSIFRDSLVGNVAEMVEHLPKLNLDNDPHIASTLAEIAAIIAPLARCPDVLRESQAQRDSAKARMAQVMKSLEGYAL